jgi:hypothetical protein
LFGRISAQSVAEVVADLDAWAAGRDRPSPRPRSLLWINRPVEVIFDFVESLGDGIASDIDRDLICQTIRSQSCDQGIHPPPGEVMVNCLEQTWRRARRP